MIKSIIVEDEKNSAERLHRLLTTHCPEIDILDFAENISSGVNSIKKYQPQLVFMDVELPDGKSFEIFNHFENIFFHVIFISAYDKYALKAIKLSAIDFIVKPIDLEELKTAIEKVSKLIENKGNPNNIHFLKTLINRLDNVFSKIALPTAEGFQFVDIYNIIKCEADRNYTKIFMNDKAVLLVSKTLKEFEDMLEDYAFCRIHNTHLINLNQVSKYVKGEGGYVIMSDNTKVDISRRKKEEFMAQLNKL